MSGHPQCKDLYDVEIYKTGKLVRKSNYVYTKIYNDAPATLKSLYKTFLDRDVGEPDVSEEYPYIQNMLAYHGWTEKLLDQPQWQMITTNLD